MGTITQFLSHSSRSGVIGDLYVCHRVCENRDYLDGLLQILIDEIAKIMVSHALF